MKPHLSPLQFIPAVVQRLVGTINPLRLAWRDLLVLTDDWIVRFEICLELGRIEVEDVPEVWEKYTWSLPMATTYSAWMSEYR